MIPGNPSKEAPRVNEIRFRPSSDVEEALAYLAKNKGISASEAASELVRWSLRWLEEFPPEPGQTIAQDLDFCRALRRQSQERLDQLLALAEVTLLDSRALERALRSRTIGGNREDQTQ